MSTAPELHPDTATDTATGVLACVRASRKAADHEEARLLRLGVDWAAMHSVDSIDDAAVFPRVCSSDIAFPVAGPGAPLVAEFCVAEFAAALGLPTEVGKVALGEAVELRYRLPKTWARVVAGDLVAWRARRIARETISHGLSPQAAAFVDAQVAGFAHKIRPSGVDRLIEEAIVRFMPEEAKRRRQAAADGRHVTVGTSQVSFEGTVWLEGEVDLADGLDLDAALGCRAAQLAALGSEAAVRERREGLHLARVENTRSFVDADQIKTWCATPDAQVVVKPVIDLAEHIHVNAYEVPGRLAEQAALVACTAFSRGAPAPPDDWNPTSIVRTVTTPASSPGLRPGSGLGDTVVS